MPKTTGEAVSQGAREGIRDLFRNLVGKGLFYVIIAIVGISAIGYSASYISSVPGKIASAITPDFIENNCARDPDVNCVWDDKIKKFIAEKKFWGKKNASDEKVAPAEKDDVAAVEITVPDYEPSAVADRPLISDCRLRARLRPGRQCFEEAEDKE